MSWQQDELFVTDHVEQSGSWQDIRGIKDYKQSMSEFYTAFPDVHVIDGGDVFKIEDKVFVGLTGRTNMHAAHQLEEIFGEDGFELVPVKVRNVLHLKSACTYLGDNYVIVADDCFDLDVLREYGKIVAPSGEEYAADCLAVNGVVLMASGYLQTKELIEREGFALTELDVSEFHKGDGTLTCLSILC